MLVSASCSTKTNTRTTTSPPPQDNVTASDRVAPCLNQQGDVTASMDCGSRNPLVGDERMAYDSPAGPITACTYRMDDRGNVIYEDPTCPIRYRQSHPQMGSSYENVRWTQESAFFDRYIGRPVKHAQEAEIAGNQGRGLEMQHHAQLSLVQAKEAQRAGYLPGVNEGIVSLRQALSSPPDSSLDIATAHVRDARISLSQAAGVKPVETRTAARFERDR